MAKRKTAVQKGNYAVPGVLGSNNERQPSPEQTTDNDRRIKDCDSARELFNRLYLENWKRAQIYAQVDNQIDGGRPFDPAELSKNGEDWRTNCNFKDAASSFIRAYMPYWKMVHEVPRKVAVTLHTMAPEKSIWQVAMAEAFDMFLDDWGADYFMQYMGLCADFVKYGPAFAMWPDAKTPRYKWAHAVQMFWPKRTKANVDDWELVCLKADMTASELWTHVKSTKDRGESQTAGWNPDAIDKAIWLASPFSGSTRYFDPAKYQDLIESNDLVMGGVWPTVKVVHLWARNHEGTKIRHYIFTETSDVDEYLYEMDEEADSFRQIFGAIFYGVGRNGLLHTIKGFGVQNYYYSTTTNRTKCRFLDSGTFALGMNFKRSADAPLESPPVENYSMVNIFPNELEQFQWIPNLQAGEAMLDMLRQNQNENNFSYTDAGTRQAIGDAPTKGQGDIIASISAEGETAISSIYLAQVGQNIFSEIFRRLCIRDGSADAKKFRKRCRDMGVPDAAFELERTIKTGASPTMAAPAVRNQIAQELLATVYPMPDANRRGILEFYVANKTGAEGVSQFLLPVGVNSDPRARREAMMENVDLGHGIPLPVDPSDAHVEHLDEHLKPLEAITQAAQQGQKLTGEHLIALQFAMPHAEEHLQYLSTNETQREAYKQMNSRLKAVQSVALGIVARLARAHDNGASAQAVMSATAAPAA